MVKGFGQAILDSEARRLRERLGGVAARGRKRAPWMRLWPNGQFSLSYKYEQEPESSCEAEEWMWVRGGVTRGSERSGPPILVSTQQSSQDEKLGSGRESAKYGLKGITRYGTKMIKSAAYLMQRRYGRFGTCFMTITVPALEKSERVLVATRWGEVMRQVIQRLSRLLKRAGQPTLVASVTELQSSRLRSYGQAYLHAHLIFPSRKKDDSGWAVDVVAFRVWYKGLLERVIGRQLDREPRVETKTIKKSAEGYLGKYMSKGSESMEGIIADLGEECVPGQQWNMSKCMRDMVMNSVVEGFDYGDLIQMYLDLHTCGHKKLEFYASRVEVDLGGRVLTVGWCGSIPEGMRLNLGLPPLDR